MCILEECSDVQITLTTEFRAGRRILRAFISRSEFNHNLFFFYPIPRWVLQYFENRWHFNKIKRTTNATLERYSKEFGFR
ncbi:hypothetical protein DPMN_134552 [Dreissena polymorpha]|uniref:Uncharacterized protein n=1 Tax=Dreissena polymorpha TaxID=45954 RepID=A0A9D4G042_DREPO|nr:hypothetical protein DPMN_134552 [Dreissena polymorpha]